MGSAGPQAAPQRVSSASGRFSELQVAPPSARDQSLRRPSSRVRAHPLSAGCHRALRGHTGGAIGCLEYAGGALERGNARFNRLAIVLACIQSHNHDWLPQPPRPETRWGRDVDDEVKIVRRRPKPAAAFCGNAGRAGNACFPLLPPPLPLCAHSTLLALHSPKNSPTLIPTEDPVAKGMCCLPLSLGSPRLLPVWAKTTKRGLLSLGKGSAPSGSGPQLSPSASL